jgi:rRNA maturation protein Nop10
MIYPDVDPKVWAKRYGINIDNSGDESDLCPTCGKVTVWAIPFADGHYRGLFTEPHNCPGDGRNTMVSVDPEIREALKNITSCLLG